MCPDVTLATLRRSTLFVSQPQEGNIPSGPHRCVQCFYISHTMSTHGPRVMYKYIRTIISNTKYLFEVFFNSQGSSACPSGWTCARHVASPWESSSCHRPRRLLDLPTTARRLPDCHKCCCKQVSFMQPRDGEAAA